MPDSSARHRDAGAVLFALVFPTVVTVVYFILLADQPAGWQQGAYLIGKLIQFGFPIGWVAWVQHQKFALRPPQKRKLTEGLLLGAVIAAGMFALYFGWLKRGGLPVDAVAAIRDKMAGIGVASRTKFVALGLFYALGHSLLEEYYWRWFVFGQLRPLAGFPRALVISSIGFMAHHVCVLAQYFGWASLFTWFFSLSVAIGGLLWGALYQRQRSLYGVWLSHLLVDAGIFAVGYDLAFR